jgi:hypothetical protein
MFLNLLGLALPALEHLSVDMLGADFGDGGLITGLQQCSHLSVLKIQGITITPVAVKPLAAALASLNALKGLSLSSIGDSDSTSAALVAQLTGLTALSFEYSSESQFKDIIAAAAGNSGLKVLRVFDDVNGGDGVMLSPATLRLLLTSCTQLTELDLSCDHVPQDVLEVLLMYGTNITSFKTYNIDTTTSFAGRHCKWRTLHIGNEYPTKLLLQANLPLHSVTDLEIGTGYTLDLHLPLDSIPVEQLPSLLHRATSNLATCPAWKVDRESRISLLGDFSDPPAQNIRFTPEQRILLLEALAPLGGNHVREFRGCIEGGIFEWGRPEVEALARSLNSTQVTELDLGGCELSVGFWAALGEELPSLSGLILDSTVTFSAFDLALFCSKIRQGQTFTTSLGQQLYQSINGAQLQASLAGQGMGHIQITDRGW